MKLTNATYEKLREEDINSNRDRWFYAYSNQSECIGRHMTFFSYQEPKSEKLIFAFATSNFCLKLDWNKNWIRL